MPSVSKKQHNFMAAIAKNPAFAKKVGIKPSVGEDFLKADKGRKFGSGGMAKSDMKEDMKADIKQDKAIVKKAFRMHDAQEHKGGKGTNLSKLKKGGMPIKKMAAGGVTKYDKTPKPSTMAHEVEAGSNKLLKFGESAVQKRGHTKGKNLGDTGPIKGIMGGAKNMAKGGTASARADGCAIKGKTKGTMMCMGGKAKK
jgi:hypothetical protein